MDSVIRGKRFRRNDATPMGSLISEAASMHIRTTVLSPFTGLIPRCISGIGRRRNFSGIQLKLQGGDMGAMFGKRNKPIQRSFRGNPRTAIGDG
jgi:hypothetical protein